MSLCSQEGWYVGVLDGGLRGHLPSTYVTILPPEQGVSLAPTGLDATEKYLPDTTQKTGAFGDNLVTAQVEAAGASILFLQDTRETDRDNPKTPLVDADTALWMRMNTDGASDDSEGESAIGETIGHDSHHSREWPQPAQAVETVSERRVEPTSSSSGEPNESHKQVAEGPQSLPVETQLTPMISVRESGALLDEVLEPAASTHSSEGDTKKSIGGNNLCHEREAAALQTLYNECDSHTQHFRSEIVSNTEILLQDMEKEAEMKIYEPLSEEVMGIASGRLSENEEEEVDSNNAEDSPGIKLVQELRQPRIAADDASQSRNHGSGSVEEVLLDGCARQALEASQPRQEIGATAEDFCGSALETNSFEMDYSCGKDQSADAEEACEIATKDTKNSVMRGSDTVAETEQANAKVRNSAPVSGPSASAANAKESVYKPSATGQVSRVIALLDGAVERKRGAERPAGVGEPENEGSLSKVEKSNAKHKGKESAKDYGVSAISGAAAPSTMMTKFEVVAAESLAAKTRTVSPAHIRLSEASMSSATDNEMKCAKVTSIVKDMSAAPSSTGSGHPSFDTSESPCPSMQADMCAGRDQCSTGVQADAALVGKAHGGARSRRGSSRIGVSPREEVEGSSSPRRRSSSPAVPSPGPRHTTSPSPIPYMQAQKSVSGVWLKARPSAAPEMAKLDQLIKGIRSKAVDRTCQSEKSKVSCALSPDLAVSWREALDRFARRLPSAKPVPPTPRASSARSAAFSARVCKSTVSTSSKVRSSGSRAPSAAGQRLARPLVSRQTVRGDYRQTGRDQTQDSVDDCGRQSQRKAEGPSLQQRGVCGDDRAVKRGDGLEDRSRHNKDDMAQLVDWRHTWLRQMESDAELHAMRERLGLGAVAWDPAGGSPRSAAGDHGDTAARSHGVNGAEGAEAHGVPALAEQVHAMCGGVGDTVRVQCLPASDTAVAGARDPQWPTSTRQSACHSSYSCGAAHCERVSSRCF